MTGCWRIPWLAVLGPVLAIGVVLCSGCGQDDPSTTRPEELTAPGRPDLIGIAPEVAERIRNSYDALDAVLRDGDASSAQRAEAFGNTGEALQAFDLLELAGVCYRNASQLAPVAVRWYYLGAVVAHQLGDIEGAVNGFSRVLEHRPADGPSLVRLGGLELERRRTDEARRRFTAALATESRGAALVGLGRAELQEGDLASARGRFEAALELYPEATRIHYWLGVVARDSGNTEAARHHFDRQGEVEVPVPDPVLAQVVNLGIGSGALLRRGDAALLAGDIEEAVSLYRRASEIDPDSVEALQSLALAVRRAGSSAAAVDLYRRALRLSPASVLLYGHLAAVLFEVGDLEAALEASEQAVSLDPGDPQAHLRWASLLADLGRFDEARATFETVVSRPADAAQLAAAWHGLGRISLARERVEDAISHFEAAVEIQPDRSDVRLQLGAALASVGRLEEGLQQFRLVIRSRPLDVQARLLEATSLVLLGQYLQAVTRLDEGIGRLPQALPLRDSLARLLATCPDDSVRRGDRALELARSAFDQEPTLERAETVAMALAELGRFDEAERWQTRMLEELGANADPELRRRLEEQRQSYRKGIPSRAPWLDTRG